MFRIALAILLLIGTVSYAAESPHDVDYASQIKPILSTKCYSCHGGLKQRSGLRLETRALMLQGGDAGNAVIVPENSGDSLLIKRITAGQDERMPPAKTSATLTDNEIALIRK